ncbi:MAG TPA: ribonucleotide-diphosphate reductase subunit beta [Candidatus Absconditabacterales bacterium]|nr:ribonucleotide-diphosphate reductase subunit beta [Candidatus Absconditabacterales bacterium]
MSFIPNQIFNPTGNDNTQERTIIKGNTTGLFNLNNTKYSWAKLMYTVMIGNFWVPEKISGLNEDSIQYKQELTEGEKKAYDGILSFLIFLDSIQTTNLPNFAEYITAPEVQLLLAIQAYQEAIHSQSYATILESVVDADKRDDIYYFRRENQILLERNTYIGKIYQNFIDNPNDENFFRGLIGNFLLEGIYFYNGFAFFDTLADHQKMKATDRMISYIRRDELTHVTMFTNILREIKKEFPEMWNEKIIYEMFTDAVIQEIKRAQHILGNNIIGINDYTTEQYTKRLANDRLSLLGLKPLYPEVKESPYKHLERLQDNNGEKTNFFESTVTNYTQSNAMQGTWDF